MRRFSLPLVAAIVVLAPLPAVAADGGGVAEQSVRLLVRYCLQDLPATQIQTELLNDGWSRIGGTPVPASSDSDESVKDIVRRANAASDSLRFYNHPELDQIISFSTASDKSEQVRDCVVDGPTIDPNALVRVLLDNLGIPVQEPPGLAHWSNWLGTKHTLILAESWVINHNFDGGMMLVLRKDKDAVSPN